MKGIEDVPAMEVKVKVNGSCHPQFEPVREAFAHNLGSGQDIGASVAVFVDGEPVAHLWGGHFDGSYTRPFERDTIVQCFSSTKTVTALCALVLADRGGIDLDAPVARYWPEFAAEGKGGIAIRQVLGHTSGMCGWTVPMTLRDLYDWEKATTLLARQAPLWTPGRTSGYHAYTQSHLIGEIFRRVTGQTMGTFLREEIARPLGVPFDFNIGTPAECDTRVSNLIQGAPQDMARGTRYYDISLYNPHPTPHDTAAIEWRRAELGGMNGHGNGLGIATLQSVLANGGAHGKRLISDKGRRRVLEQQSDGVDLVLGAACRWGMAFALETLIFPGVPPGARAAWWGGNGGSMSFIDLDARMAIGFTPNRWISGSHETDRARAIVQAAYQSLERRS